MIPVAIRNQIWYCERGHRLCMEGYFPSQLKVSPLSTSAVSSTCNALSRKPLCDQGVHWWLISYIPSDLYQMRTMTLCRSRRRMTKHGGEIPVKYDYVAFVWNTGSGPPLHSAIALRPLDRAGWICIIPPHSLLQPVQTRTNRVHSRLTGFPPPRTLLVRPQHLFARISAWSRKENATEQNKCRTDDMWSAWLRQDDAL